MTASVTIVASLIALLQVLFPQKPTTLLFVGDAMMHKAQIDAAQRGGDFDYDECFASLSEKIQKADFAVANLECPLGGKPYAGYPCFSAPDVYADALQRAGFDMFFTANNHTLDRHDKGLRATVAHLDSIGIHHLGTYANVKARQQALPKIVDVNGIKIGFLNYTYGTNGISATNGAVVDYIDKPLIKSDIEKLKDSGAELLCVAMHWGNEYQLYASSQQKLLADYLCGLGVDMIIGGHPHVVQPAEMRVMANGRKVFLCYSLGNFISNMKTRDTRGGALANVYLSRDSEGKAQIDSARCELLFTVPPTNNCKNFRVMAVDSVKGEWASARDAFVSSAAKVIPINTLK